MISGNNFYVQGLVPGVSSEVVFDGKEVVDVKRFSEHLSPVDKKQRFNGREIRVSFGSASSQGQVPVDQSDGFARARYFMKRCDSGNNSLNSRFSRVFDRGLTCLEGTRGNTLQASATSDCKESKILMGARAVVEKAREVLERRLQEAFSLDRGESKNTASEKKRFLDTVTSELGNAEGSTLLSEFGEQLGYLLKDENVKKLFFGEITAQLQQLKVEVASKLRQLKLDECIPELKKFKEEYQRSWSYEGIVELELEDAEAVHQALQTEISESGDVKKTENPELSKKLHEIASSHCEAVVMQDIIVKDKVLKLMNELLKESLIREYPCLIKSLIEFDYKKKSEADALKIKYLSLCFIDSALRKINNIPDDPLIVPKASLSNRMRIEMRGLASQVKDFIRDKFDYEINIVEELPSKLREELLKVKGVFGFGHMYDVLNIDLKAGLSDQEIEDAENKIANILKGREYSLRRGVSLVLY